MTLRSFIATTTLFPALALLVAPDIVRSQAPAPLSRAEAEFQKGAFAWERGDYPAALTTFDELLGSNTASSFVSRIATITGERYRTVELTTDGSSPAVSANGEWVAWESGAGGATWLHIARVANGVVTADSMPGSGFTFASGTGAVRGVYVRVPESAELATARAEVTRAQRAREFPAMQQASARARDLERRSARLIVRDLAAGTDTDFGNPGFAVHSPVFAADGSSLYVLGDAEGGAGTDIYRVALPGGSVTRVTTSGGVRANLVAVAGGRVLMYSTAAGGNAAPGARGGANAFALYDLNSGEARVINGAQPVVSASGNRVAWIETDGSASVLKSLPLPAVGEPVEIVRTTDRLNTPALSPNGATVAYSRMPRENWELYVSGTDGKGDRQFTHDVQHDILPMWISNERLLGVMGEGRHRRSYLYDLETGVRERLFHNNTVRTIAPEYQWVASTDGSTIVIQSERDGDTVSPERGVYITRLDQELPATDIRARVRAQLATEQELRQRTTAMFAPITHAVRPVAQLVSKDRIYSYERDLFAFGSKHITQPGNAKAIDYLTRTYASFGYEPDVQWFETRGVRTANIVATLRGTVSPDVVYVVGSHFDSVERGPGAADNTSGTSMLLETARVLHDRPLPATVMFVSFTGEEAGLLGSREFVRNLVADSVALAGAMNNDMMGFTNDQRLDNTIRYSNPGIRDVQHGAALQYSDLITYDALYYKSTDAAAFYEAYGDIVGGFGSYPVLANPHYHQSHDLLETINHELITETTRANVATLMYLASAPQRLRGLEALVGERGTATLSWQPSPETDVISYLVEWEDGGRTRSQRVRETQVRLSGVNEGTEVRVKAVNNRGLEGWDWARVVVR
jgi:aminopeptidase YwaD